MQSGKFCGSYLSLRWLTKKEGNIMYRVIIVDADVNYRTIHTTGIDAVNARRICNRLNLSFAGTPSVYAYVEQIG